MRFNPWKGFGLVEAGAEVVWEATLFVSIPERVLGWLKHKPQTDSQLKHMFQSLKGFWVGWSQLVSQTMTQQ